MHCARTTPRLEPQYNQQAIILVCTAIVSGLPGFLAHIETPRMRRRAHRTQLDIGTVLCCTVLYVLYSTIVQTHQVDLTCVQGFTSSTPPFPTFTSPFPARSRELGPMLRQNWPKQTGQNFQNNPHLFSKQPPIVFNLKWGLFLTKHIKTFPSNEVKNACVLAN
jgi:hypothetical protein